MTGRWDETWHRLLVWTSGQAPSERLAAQVLLHDGFSRLDPSHPLGGPDGKKDAMVRRDGLQWIMAVYFPRGQQPFKTIKDKFVSDIVGVAKNDADGIAFVTNQELSLGERKELYACTSSACEIYHLERIVTVLDQPVMAPIRAQYLNIGSHESIASPPQAVFIHPVLPVSEMKSRLVGRSDELLALEEFLAPLPRTEVRAHVSVVAGMPGVGKTALAVESAAKARAKGLFSGGAFLIDFKGYEENPQEWVGPSHVLSGLLVSLGAERTDPDPTSNFASYQSLLTAKEQAGCPILLLFDNVADIRQVQDILPPAGAHRVIITSRNSLGPRIPLSQSFLLSTLSEGQSATLIIQGDKRRFADQLEGLRALANLCGGLPIALHLVSQILANEPELCAVELARELEEEATRLAGLEFEDSKIRAVFRGSYLRLSDEAAKCFRYLAIHPGKEVTALSTAHLLDVTRVSARQALRRLESSHLITRDYEQATWKLHDLLRLYGRETAHSIDSRQEQDAALHRLFTYYFETIEQVNAWLNDNVSIEESGSFTSAKNSIDWAAREHANIVACISAASDIGSLVDAWRLAIAIHPYLFLRGEWSTGIETSESAIEIAKTLKDKEKEANALNNYGLALNLIRRYADGKKQFMRARKLFRELGEKESEAQVLVGLAESMRGEGNIVESIPILRRSILLYTETQYGRGAGFALTNLGTSLRESGQHQEAIKILEEALAIHRSTGARRAEAATLGQLGTAIGDHAIAVRDKRRFNQAISVLADSKHVAEEVGDDLLRGMCDMNTANFYRIGGKKSISEKLYLDALAAFEQVNNEWHQAMALINLSRLYRDYGDTEKQTACIQKVQSLGAVGHQVLEQASETKPGFMNQ